MNIICWNCGGACKAATIRELRDLAKQFAPTMLCIVETQISKARVESLAGTLGFNNSYAVGSSGRSGGIGLFWNDGIKLDVFGYSEYHVDETVSSSNQGTRRLTCVYGEAQVGERYRTWDLLKSLVSVNDLPWLCIGDFYEVLPPHEHVGTGQRRHTQIQAFREALDVCALADIG